MRGAAETFKALSDEARLSMIWLLLHHEELCVCDFMEVLGFTQSKASRHLATLRHAGLVEGRRDGVWVHYSLRPAQRPEEVAQREAVRATLASKPEARHLLESLAAWLAKKAAGCGCD